MQVLRGFGIDKERGVFSIRKLRQYDGPIDNEDLDKCNWEIRDAFWIKGNQIELSMYLDMKTLLSY